MRIGMQIASLNGLGNPADFGRRLTDVARAVEQAGFYSLWLPDHLLNAMVVLGRSLADPVLEAYSTVSFLAAVTQRVKLGVQVTCPVFRHPAVLVKMVSTIDVLSGGRTYLGLGAGWFDREANALGIDFPATAQRFERLEETLQIVKHMWAGNSRPYAGKYYRLPGAINSPQPLSQPHPPIMIGGEGEKRTLRLVAKYGDACNIRLGAVFARSGGSSRLDTLQRKLGVLRQHCADVGRGYDLIEKTVQVWLELTGDTSEISRTIELCHQLAGYGIQHIIFSGNVHEHPHLETLCEQIVTKVAVLR